MSEDDAPDQEGEDLKEVSDFAGTAGEIILEHNATAVANFVANEFRSRAGRRRVANQRLAGYAVI